MLDNFILSTMAMYFVVLLIGLLARTLSVPVYDVNDNVSNFTGNVTHRGTRATYLPHVIRICAFNIKTFGKAKMSDPVKAGIIRDVRIYHPQT